MDVAVVAVCDSVPEIAGLVAHYLSIAFDVLHREGHRAMRVGVIGPYSLGDSMHAVAVGEPAHFEVLDGSERPIAVVTMSGLERALVSQFPRLASVPVHAVRDHIGEAGNDRDVVAIADACIRVARRIVAGA